MDAYELQMIEKPFKSFNSFYLKFESAEDIFAQMWKTNFPHGWRNIEEFKEVPMFIKKHQITIDDNGEVVKTEKKKMKRKIIDTKREKGVTIRFNKRKSLKKLSVHAKKAKMHHTNEMEKTSLAICNADVENNVSLPIAEYDGNKENSESNVNK